MRVFGQPSLPHHSDVVEKLADGREERARFDRVFDGRLEERASRGVMLLEDARVHAHHIEVLLLAELSTQDRQRRGNRLWDGVVWAAHEQPPVIRSNIVCDSEALAGEGRGARTRAFPPFTRSEFGRKILRVWRSNLRVWPSFFAGLAIEFAGLAIVSCGSGDPNLRVWASEFAPLATADSYALHASDGASSLR
jgi:hypothetical protein